MYEILSEVRKCPVGRQSNRPTINDYGALLRERRQARGLTMEALAERADTTNPVISLLERGLRNPSKDMVKKLARGYAPSDADAVAISRLTDEALIAAGFAPEGSSYAVVAVSDRPARSLSPAEERLLHLFETDEAVRNILSRLMLPVADADVKAAFPDDVAGAPSPASDKPRT